MMFKIKVNDSVFSLLFDTGTSKLHQIQYPGCTWVVAPNF